MRILLPFALLLLSTHAAEPPIEWGRLRQVTRPLAPRQTSRRNHLTVATHLLEQAARKLDNGQNAAAEFEGIQRIRKLLTADPAFSRPLDRLPTMAPTAENLRAAAATLTLELLEPPPTSIIAVQPEPPLPRQSLAPGTQASPQDRHLAGELDADSVVLLSPEIRAQAAALGNDPARIFAFVNNEIELEWHRGAMQNSLAVLWSRRAGAVDQSTLLIALLRAAGIPARYVFGSIRLSSTQLMQWTGAKTPEAAIFFASQASPLESAGDEVTVDHVWVEASIADNWIALDPAFKLRDYQPGIVIPRIPFRRDDFLKQVTTATAGEAYLDQLREYLRANLPGVALSDLAYSGPIRRVSATALPAAYPYTVTRTLRRIATLEPEDKHRIVITLSAPAGGAVYFTKELFLPEVCLNSLTISSIANGGAASPRNGTATFRPSLYADDTVIAEGNTPLVNANLNIRVQYFPIGGDPIDNQRIIQPGQLLGIPFSAFHGSQYLNYRINRLLSSNYRTGDAGPVIRDILNITGIRYMQRLTETRRSLTAPLQLAPVNVRALYGFTYGVPGLIADRPVMTPNSLGMDMIGTGRIPIVDLTSGDSATAELRGFRQTLGLTASGLEHQTCEEIALMTSASTTKVLQTASELGIPIVALTPENAATAIPELEYTPAERNQLVGRFFSGSVLILVPKRPVPLGDFRFFAYVAEDNLGFGLYIINGAAGGTVVNPRSGPPEKAGSNGTPRTGGLTVGDPVNVANGNFLFAVTDLYLPARGFPLQFKRSYSSQSTVVGPLGLGWTHSYNMSLQVSANSIQFTDGTGGVYTLTRSGTDFVSTVDLGWRISPDGADYVLRNRAGFAWRFTSAGRLRSMSDLNGNQATFTYDTAGRLTAITDPSGRQLTLTYDARNRISAVQDPAGRRVAYFYDPTDHLFASTDVGGNRTAYTYATGAAVDQNLTSITDAEGNTTRFAYYADDKVFKTVNAAGAEMMFFYLPYQQTTVAVDERGFATTYQYDAAGRVVRTTDPENSVAQVVFGTNGLPAETTDAGGAVSRYAYDERGNQISATDALGNLWSFTYEPQFNRLTSITDPLGRVARGQYDAKGNLTRWIDSAGFASNRAYDSFGSLTSTTDAAGNTATLTYDANGQLTQSKDALGNLWKIERDSASRPIRQTNPLGAASTIEYDTAGNLKRLTSPLGAARTFAYNRLGRLSQSTDPNQSTSRFMRSASGRLSGVVTPSGEQTQYAYDALDQLAGVRNATGAAWEITRNHRGQPLETRNPVGDVAREFYDGRGNVVSRQFADGATVSMTYDLASRLIERRYSDGATDTYTYDAAGNLVSASNAAVTYTMTYDARNYLTSLADSRFASPIRYQYDSLGRRSRMTDPQGGVTQYTYDPAGKLTAVRNPAGLATRFTYDAAGRPVKTDFANNTSAAYQWDADNRLLALTYTSGAVTNQFAYGYDAAGNRVSMTDSGGSHQFTYDSSYRLTSATHPDQPNERYAYDAASNRVSSHRDSDLTYDAANRLLATGDTAFTYDRRGSVTTRGAQQLTYDTLRRLTAVTGPTGAVTYQYDPLGRRIAKSVNGQLTQYLYDGAKLMAEYTGDGRLTARYTQGIGADAPLIMERDVNGDGAFDPSEAFFYQADAIGSVRALADSSGQVVEQYRYDSFGNLVQPAPSGTAGNRFLFTSREWDAETGLYDYRARTYDPLTGRFLQSDAFWNVALPKTLNRYTYASNNPINLVDPSGNTAIANDAALQQALGQLDQEFEAIMNELSSSIPSQTLQGQVDLQNYLNRLNSLSTAIQASQAAAAMAASEPKPNYDEWIHQAAAEYDRLLKSVKVLYIGRGNRAEIEPFAQFVETPQIRVQDTEPVKRDPNAEPQTYTTIPTDQPGVVIVRPAPTQ